jgi:hypothetical protein
MLFLRLLTVFAAVALAVPAAAQVPPERMHRLAHGVNFTNWFRYPARSDDAYFRDDIDDVALSELRRAGFTFVRVAVQPELMLDASGRPDGHRLEILVGAIGRIERHDLAVVVGWHPQSWHLEDSPDQRRELQELWGALAQRLRPLSADMTFPEVLNEPVFDGNAAAWETLQRAVLARIRTALPAATVVLTGNHWGAIDGLQTLHPVADGNVVYSFHVYDPPVLTTLASFDPSLQSAALARLPFPVDGPHSCDAAAEATRDKRTIDVVRFYCSERWSAARLQALVAQAAEWGRRNHVALLAGEFGASDRLPAPTRLAWIAAMRAALEADGIGWALWGYDDSMGFDIHPTDGVPAPLDPALLQALGLRDHA